MTQQPPSRSRLRLAVAVVATCLLVLAAPFFGVARSQLRTLFPAQFSLIVYSLVGVAVLGAVAAAFGRVREHRLARLGAMVAAVLVAAAYVRWTGSPDPSIRAVETFHFVQYGAITYLFHLAWRHADDGSAFVLPAIAAFIAGVAEEAFQWFLPARVGELKDVWLNGVAIVCGVVASNALAPPVAFAGWSRHATRRTSRMLAGAVVALAAFVHLVHLGVEIREGDVRFASRYTADELARASGDRQALWRTNPPLVRPDRMSREDQFMTEGLQHVQARNLSWAAGDAVGAWRENEILERHFAVVLDTPSYVAREGHRWPPEQRRDAESRAHAEPPRPFTSRAYPYPIYTWSPFMLWLAALAAAALLWPLGAST